MNPPAESEIQIIVFGQIRGYGESILIHLGDNFWIIVDSCLNENNEPVALSHLNEISVNACEAVKLVVATHWHDDHIKGLSKTVSACKLAKLAIPSVFTRQE